MKSFKKQALAILLVAISLIGLCSCSNNVSDTAYQKQPLTAKNFTTLMDSNYFLYTINKGKPMVFYFANGGSSFAISQLTESLDIDYSKLSAALCMYDVEAFDDSHFSITPSYYSGINNYHTAYSDPDGNYIVFVSENVTEGNEYPVKQLTVMTKELQKSVWNKLLGNSENYPKSVEEWVALIDSCK